MICLHACIVFSSCVLVDEEAGRGTESPGQISLHAPVVRLKPQDSILLMLPACPLALYLSANAAFSMVSP